MTEPAAVAPVEPTVPVVAVTPPVDEQRVPYDRFKAVNEERQALATQVEALSKWKSEQEAASLSELERAQSAAQEATTRAEQAERRTIKLEHTQLVRQAAAAAGFTDPDDAVAFLDSKLSELDDSDKATAAVTELAARKAHLIAPATPPPPPKPPALGTLTGGHSTTPPSPASNGEPDKAGLGAELMAGLFGKR